MLPEVPGNPRVPAWVTSVQLVPVIQEEGNAICCSGVSDHSRIRTKFNRAVWQMTEQMIALCEVEAPHPQGERDYIPG